MNYKEIDIFSFKSKALISLMLFIFVSYFLLVTRFTGNLFDYEKLGSAYDSLAKNLLLLQAWVDEHAIEYEALYQRSYLIGKTYMYFGIFPALPRILLNFVFPEYYGKWSRLSCLLAAMLSMFAFINIMKLHLSMNKNLSTKEKLDYFYLSTLSFYFATPLLYSICSADIYREARWWGFCWLICGYYFLAKIIYNNRCLPSDFFKFSICASLALLSRVPCGIPLYPIALLFLIVLFFKLIKSKLKFLKSNEQSAYFMKLFLASCPIWIGAVIQAWYNIQRFGDITTFITIYIYDLQTNPSRLACIEKYGILNILRVPFNLINYFGFSFDYFKKDFPFIRFKCTYTGNSGLFPDNCDINLPLSISSPWILIGAILGLIVLIRTKNAYLLKICIILFTSQSLITLSFYAASYKYNVEFLPLLLILYCHFLSQVGSQKFYNETKKYIFNLLLLMCVISTITTFLGNVDRSLGKDWAVVQNLKDLLFSINHFRL